MQIKKVSKISFSLILVASSLSLNADGFNKDGFNKNGFNRDGFNKVGYDKDGYDKNGYDKKIKTKTLYIGGNVDSININQKIIVISNQIVYVDNLSQFIEQNNLKIGDSVLVIGTLNGDIINSEKITKNFIK